MLGPRNEARSPPPPGMKRRTARVTKLHRGAGQIDEVGTGVKCNRESSGLLRRVWGFALTRIWDCGRLLWRQSRFKFAAEFVERRRVRATFLKGHCADELHRVFLLFVIPHRVLAADLGFQPRGPVTVLEPVSRR